MYIFAIKFSKSLLTRCRDLPENHGPVRSSVLLYTGRGISAPAPTAGGPTCQARRSPALSIDGTARNSRQHSLSSQNLEADFGSSANDARILESANVKTALTHDRKPCLRRNFSLTSRQDACLSRSRRAKSPLQSGRSLSRHNGTTLGHLQHWMILMV
jgi:hypothetical protein